jgi:hypothetical protein
MPLDSAAITRQIMQGGYRGMGGVNNIGRSGIDFSAYPYAHGPTITQPVTGSDVPPRRQGAYAGSVPVMATNVPIRALTPAGTTEAETPGLTGVQMVQNNPFAFGNWTVPDQVGPEFGRSLQQQGLMPASLVYNAETRTWG